MGRESFERRDVCRATLPPPPPPAGDKVDDDADTEPEPEVEVGARPAGCADRALRNDTASLSSTFPVLKLRDMGRACKLAVRPGVEPNGEAKGGEMEIP